MRDTWEEVRDHDFEFKSRSHIYTLEHEKALCISHSSPVLEPCGCASALSPQASPLLHAIATASALHRCCLLLIADVSTDVTIKSHHHFSHSNQMTNSHTNEATQGNEDERKSVINRTPEFYTDLSPLNGGV
ncbi:hypothetical protein L2E82_22205 [Cichorium intybus]|uniref:Uncharacterized protein n=1 Tax=Cichorium intybus TaxID=13427 RepID=A0ACB9DWZ9_CICIN|nr:hypothetical protein L2E82_22205 [Cichorium intybus]